MVCRVYCVSFVVGPWDRLWGDCKDMFDFNVLEGLRMLREVERDIGGFHDEEASLCPMG